MHQSGTNITGYVTIPFLNLTNTPITGAVQGSAISFGDSNQMVKYDGTFAGPTSATGTFHAIRWGGVDGTWSLTQAMPPFDDVPAVYPVAGIWSNVLTSTMAQGEVRHPMEIGQSGNSLGASSGFGGWSGFIDEGWTINGRVSGTQAWLLYYSGLAATQFTLFTGTVGSAYAVSGNYITYDLSGAPAVTDNGSWNTTICVVVAGSSANLSSPTGLALDASGNIFVADNQNNTIRQITPSGDITTLAGTAGTVGRADGTGAAARFSDPTGVAADNLGNVYVVDSENAGLRKIVVSTGVVTTIMENSWTFNPRGVAVDADGNVYVVSRIEYNLLKVTPSSVITTLAGTEQVSGTAVAVDSAGNVYVTDDINNVIHRITPSGYATILAGTAGKSGSDDGTGATARFNGPSGVAVDALGNVYVADGSTIRKITPAGVVSTFLDVGTGVTGVAVDGSGVLFFTVDSEVLKTELPGIGSSGSTGGNGGADGAEDDAGVGGSTDAGGNGGVSDVDGATNMDGTSGTGGISSAGATSGCTTETGGSILESLVVPTDGSVITSGRTYPTGVSQNITVSGTVVWGNCDSANCPNGGFCLYRRYGDAKYITDDCWKTNNSALAGYPDSDFLNMNGLDPPVDWNPDGTTFSPQHVYTISAPPDSIGHYTFQYLDYACCYGDNSGVFSVTISEPGC
jgi:hypothetical protein